MGIFQSDNKGEGNDNINDNDFLFELDEQKDIRTNYTVDKDGSIRFNFKYLANESEELTLAISSFKNFLRLESPNDLTAITLKLNEMKSNITKTEKLVAYDGFISIIKEDYDKYLDCLNLLFNELNQLYRSIHSFLKSCLKKQQTHSFNQEIDNCSYLLIKTMKVFNGFAKFEREYSYIQQLKAEMKFVIDNENSLDQIIEFYNKNKKELSLNFTFQSEFNFKSFINSLNLITTFLDSKNLLLKKLIEAIETINKMYTSSLRLKIQAHDCMDIIRELYDYYNIIIKHRLVRHIELRLKDINDSRHN